MVGLDDPGGLFQCKSLTLWFLLVGSTSEPSAQPYPPPTLWALTALWPQPPVTSHSTYSSWSDQGACVQLHHHPDTTKTFTEDRGQISVGEMTTILGIGSFLNWVKGLASLCLDGGWNCSMCEDHWGQEWHHTAELQRSHQVPSLLFWGKAFCGVCPGPKCSSM